MTAFAAGLSESAELVQAVQEAIAQVRDGLGPGEPPDVALLFVTPHHRALVPEAAKFVQQGLRPGALLGCVAESVVGGKREVERSPGLSLWAGRTGPVTPFHLDLTDTPDGPTITGWPDGLDRASVAVVLADPFSFPADDLLQRMDEDHPGLPLIGGMALGGPDPDDTQLVIDDRVVESGAVGVLLGQGVAVTTVVSSACRPIGDPFVVTRAEGLIVHELGGRPPLERLNEMAGQLSEADQGLLRRGIHLGRVIDEHKETFERGDFLVHGVVAGDTGTGAVELDDVIEIGATAQFQVRDPASAGDDLRHQVGGRAAEAALVFTCSGRGRRLFRRPDHDAGVISECLDGAAVAGMFCAGEIGPLGGRNLLHTFTASVALLTPAGSQESS